MKIKSFARSGIKKYYYKVDEGSFIESDSDILDLNELIPDKEYKVTIVVEDNLGQKKEITIKINTNNNSGNDSKDEQNNTIDNNNDNNDDNKNDNDNKKNNKKDGKNDKDPSKDHKDDKDDPKPQIIKEIPQISLSKVPYSFKYGENYSLPSSYKFGKSGGNVSCSVEDKQYTDTSKLGIGKHKIRCTAISNTGISVNIEKQVEIVSDEKDETVLDGWITMNLYYPENSINWQWRLGDESEIRQGNDSGWKDYTGPITIRISEVEKVFIRYDIEDDGKIKPVIIPPFGKMLVDIEPNKYELTHGEKTIVKINYQEDANQKQYKINDSEWMDYTEPFEVGENTLVEARVMKKEKIYDSNGKEIGTKRNINTDSVYIKDVSLSDEKRDFSVKIKTNKKSIKSNEKATISIDYTGECDQKQYRINNGDWTNYTKEFEVTSNSLIEARAIKIEYDYSTGNAVEYKNYKYDILRIGENETILNVSINPNTTTLDINSTTNVNIDYDENATSKRYRINNGSWKDYTGEFIVGVNTLIEAEAIGENSAYGYASTYINKKIDKKPKKPSTYLSGPLINLDPESVALSTKVSIVPQEAARIIYVKIDNGSWQKYTEPIEITENKTIHAKYIRESDGKESDISSKYINNIKQYEKPYVLIKTTPSLFEKTENMTVTIIGDDCNKLEYSFDGVIYQTYVEPLTITQNTRLYAKGTNDIGEKIEYIDITNIGNNPPLNKEHLMLSIDAVPEKSDRLYSSTIVTINYDKKATEKYYKLGNGEWKKYTEPFQVEKNTLVRAYETSNNGSGSATKKIDFLTDGIMEPNIEIDPTDKATESVLVTIDYDKNAIKKKYQIGNGELLDYTEPFKVSENTDIYAYNENVAGEVSTSTKKITNIVAPPRVVVIDKGSYIILKLNYPINSIESTRKYKYQKDGVWKKYNSNGILFIKNEYKDEIMGKEDNPVIKVKDDNNRIITFTDHYYIIEQPMNELIGDIYMSWDPYIPEKATFTLSTTEPTKNVDVQINYDKRIKDKYYKIIDNKGRESEWMKYINPITITDNNTIIYAKGITSTEEESEISSKKITNIDKIDPNIIAKADFKTPTRQLTIQIEATDNLKVNEVGYAKGSKSVEYFEDNGDFIDNKGTFKVKENGIYTIYANDKAGNYVIKTIEVNNIDQTAPDIDINVLTKSYSAKAEIEINYGDSVVKQYKIGNTGEYTTYTDKIVINSTDVYQFANSDGTLTIFAKGIDQAGNSQEVSEIVYVLDLDVPKTPVINAKSGYPIITEYGIRYDNIATIDFDDRDDIDNYYSLDGGTTWKLYTGKFEITNKKVKAKSVKKESGLTVSASKSIVMPTDALPIETYDNDESTYIGTEDIKYIDISSEVIGQQIAIKGDRGSNGVAPQIKFYSDKKVIASYTAFGTYTIPEGATRMSFVGSPQSRYYWCFLTEIKLLNAPVLGINKIYPKMTEYGVEKGYSIVSAKYFQTAVKKLYSLDNGLTWENYSGEIKLSLGKVVSFKSIDKDGVSSSVSKYTSVLPTDAMTDIAYDNNNSTYIATPDIKYIDISSELAGQQISIIGDRGSNGVAPAIKFYSGKTVLISYTVFGTYTIPEGTTKMSFVGHLDSDHYWCRLRELKILNAPVLKINKIYPKITKYGIEKGYSTVSAEYFQTSVKKLYSLDNGVTWEDYPGEIKLQLNKTVLYKSIDKDGTSSDISTYTSVLPADAMTSAAYDNKNSTYIATEDVKYIDISSELIGQQISLVGNRGSNGVAPTIIFYAGNTKLATYTAFGTYKVPAKTTRLSFKGYPQSRHYWCMLYEIGPVVVETKPDTPDPEIIVEAPKIVVSNDDIWTTSKNVNITYPTGNYENEYSFDAENWFKYTGTINITGPTTIYARSTLNNETISSSTYQITKIDNNEPEISLEDLPISFIVGNSYDLPSKVNFNGKSGITTICYANDQVVNNTKDLNVGNYTIRCVVTTGANKSKTIEKNIQILDNEKILEENKTGGITNEEEKKSD